MEDPRVARHRPHCGLLAMHTSRSLLLTIILLSTTALTSRPASAQVWETCNLLHSWTGEAAGDQFGWVAVRAGDVDGDQVQDVVIGAPFHDGGGVNSGKAYVYSGASGALLFSVVGSATENLGWAVAAAGDLNADGFGDLLVGAPGSTTAAAGRLLVLSGATGSPLWTALGQQAGDLFGSSVSAVDDLDGDGVADVLVGALSDDSSGVNAGKAYVFSGASGSLLRTHLGPMPGDNLGVGVAGIDDRDTDGAGDYLLSGHNAGPGSRGRVWVHSGQTGSLSCTLNAAPTGANFGQFFLGRAGDVDADGQGDFFVSDFNDSAGVGASTGQAFVYSGVDCSELSRMRGSVAGDGFAIGRGYAGDIDGDGHDDLFFGSWLADDGGANAGKGEIRSGADGSILGQFVGDLPGATLGFDADSLGDVDGDGVTDYLLTAAGHASSRGAVYVLSGSPAPPAGFCESAANSVGSGARIGYRRSASLSANDFRVRVEGAVPGETGLFFYAASGAQLPFGDGFLCVGAPRLRIGPPLTISASGSRQLQLDFQAAPFASGPGQVSAGTTWYFQFWYRDPAGPGGSGINLSDGLRVTWCP